MSEGTFKELPVISAGPKVRGADQGDPIVGIDLGTSNSLVAIVEQDAAGNRVPRVIQTREGRNLLPSVVRFRKDGGRDVGFAARKERVRDSEHTVFSVKRLLGRGAADVKDLVGHLPLDLEASSATNVRLRIEGQSYTPIEISAMILRELKAAAEDELGRAVEDAVITVPAYFNDSQRQATRAAGRLAGLNVLRILNEPTAASLAYGLAKKKNGLIAVYDLGGGTFDVSVLRLRDNVFEVLATNGDTRLGGDDIDEAIAEWLEAAIKKAHPEADYAGRDARAALLEASENLKIALSGQTTADAEIALSPRKSFPERQAPFKARLTREELARLARPLLERTRKPVENVLRDAGIGASELTNVVLVGGPTRLETVKRFVAELFDREPDASMHPEEVVALGAAIQADILAGNNRDFLLLDVVPLSLGIETFGGGMSKLIPRNTTVPSMAREQFTTYVEGQTKVAINVFQGERELVEDNRRLAEFVLHGIPPLPAGVARVEVTFLVDADGILSVTAREHYSGVESSIEVKPTYGLTDAEVERMLAEGLANSEEDRRAARLLEAKNDARTVLVATEKALAEARGLLEDKEAKAIDGLVASLKAALASTAPDAVEAIKNASKALNQGTTRLAELLMSQTLDKGLKNRRVREIL